MVATARAVKRGAQAQTSAAPVAAPVADLNAEMMQMFQGMPEDEKKAFLAEYRHSAFFKQMFGHISTFIAGNTDIKVEDGDCIILGADGEFRVLPSDENGEDFIATLDASEDEDEEGEEDETDDAPASKPAKRQTSTKTGKQRGPGRPPSLIKALREYMKEEGKNQTDIAGLLDVTPAAVNHWLRKGTDPRNGTAEKLRKLVAHYLPS